MEVFPCGGLTPGAGLEWPVPALGSAITKLLHPMVRVISGSRLYFVESLNSQLPGVISAQAWAHCTYQATMARGKTW